MLPAHAGMIPCFNPSLCAAFSAPRACGDDPNRTVELYEDNACSPRMRG